MQQQSVSNSLDSEPQLLDSVIIVPCCQGPGSLKQGPHFHPQYTCPMPGFGLTAVIQTLSP